MKTENARIGTGLLDVGVTVGVDVVVSVVVARAE